MEATMTPDTVPSTFEKKTIPLLRLVPALIVGPGCWLGPYIVMNSLFLPQLITQLVGEADKVNTVALFASMGMVVAAISNMVAGNVSDKTRTRFGSRTPWIMAGALVFMLAAFGCSMATSVPMLLVMWMLGQVGLNFIVAPMVAWIDFAPVKGQGLASSAYGGLGMALGNNGFNVVGALFLSQYRMGFAIFGLVAFLGTLVACLIAREPSNLDVPRPEAKSKEKLAIASVVPTWKEGRDYYLALIAKMLQGVGNFAITGYLLFILTDFLGFTDAGTQSSVQLINGIMLVLGIVCGLFAGPLSDRTGLLKLPVALSTISLAVAALCMLLLQNAAGIALYGFFAGVGMGLWNSLDNLLNLRVIPDQNRVALFLGVYNLGNTVTQAVAPVIAAFVIGMVGYAGVFVVSIAFALAGGVCALSIRSVKR